MIIFVGNKENGFFIKEIINDTEINYTGYIPLEMLEQSLLETQSECVVIDVTLWTDSTERIIENIVHIAAAMRNKLIIYAPGYNLNSKLCSNLRSHGIQNIITAGMLAGVKDEFTAFYNNKNTENTPIIPIVQTENLIDNNSKITSIAICGSQHRIGTTTQCLQITKYLKSNGYKAAYIEFNNNGYVDKLRTLFSLSQNQFEFEGIDIYSQKEINLLSNYDYIVYDYGCITDSYFNQYSFLERQNKIIVCGAKPDEIDFSTQALRKFNSFNDIHFIFSFVSKEDESDISALMGEHSTYFSPLIPDSFTVLLAQQELYKSMQLCKVNSSAVVSAKKSWFSRRRKNG